MKEKIFATVKVAFAGMILGMVSAAVIGLVVKIFWKAFLFGFNLL